MLIPDRFGRLYDFDYPNEDAVRFVTRTTQPEPYSLHADAVLTRRLAYPDTWLRRALR